MSDCLAGIPVHHENPLGFAFRRWRTCARFRRAFGRPFNPHAPTLSEEKVLYRKLYGNHAVYAFLADKYRVREFVRERVGERYLIPLLGVHERLTPAIFDDLPDRFIIKATHGCKWHQIVRDKSQLDVDATVKRFNRLMRRRRGRTSGEYHYRLIEPRIVIEALLDDGGDSPPDYDFFCFHSDGGFDYALAVVMPGGARAVHFDKDWTRVEMTCTAEEAARVARPVNFEEMVDVAERLSRGFDCLRIDLYNVAGRISFGEVTCTPAAGIAPIANRDRSERFARLWKLDRHNRRLYQSDPRERAAAA
ncbi:MAG: ATP-grasp fold amidoligase family protein [Planctomycetia bacterium]